MNEKKQNPALTGAIIPTFFYYVIPSVIGLVAITTASLVDGIFVGNYIGPEALAAITLLIPYFTLMFGIAIMLAIGGSVRAGFFIGANKPAAASAIFSKSLISTVFIAFVFALISLIFEQRIYQMLAAPPAMYDIMQQYFSIIRWVLIIQLLTMVLYYFVRADGHPLLATIALVSGALLNIALDFYFIAYLDLGLAGAAYATAIAQVIQLTILSGYFLSPQRTLVFSLRQTRWHEILQSAYNGVSEFINEISVGIIMLLLNWLLMTRAGIDGVAAFTIVNYFIFLSLMLSYGIADVLHLVVSQNLGANNPQRIRQFLFTASTTVLIIGALLVFGLMFWQDSMIGLFLSSDADSIATLASRLLMLIWPLFLVNGFNVILSCYLTAIDRPLPSASIAVSRSLILPACLLSGFYWLMQHWRPPVLDTDWAFLIALPLAEWLTFFLALTQAFRFRPQPLIQA